MTTINLPAHMSDIGPNQTKRKLLYEALPDFSREKITRMEDADAMRSGQWLANAERIQKNREARAEIHRVWHLVDNDIKRGMTPTPEIKAEQVEREAEIARLDEEHCRLRAFKLPPTMPASFIWEWLDGLPVLRVVRPQSDDWDRPEGTFVPKGQDVIYPSFRPCIAPRPKGAPADALAKARANISTIHETRKQVIRADRPLAEAEQAAIGEIDRAIAKPFSVEGCLRRHVRLNGRVEHGRIKWPTRRIMTGAGMADVPDAFSLLLWLNRDTLIRRALEALRAAHDPKNALSDEDRAARLAELDADLLEQERIEEAALEACEDAGLKVFRRPNADPRAVLGVEVIPPDPENDFG